MSDIKAHDTLRYSNITFKNTSTIPLKASKIESRSTIILEKANDWVMSVIRFDVDSQALPINIPLMKNLPVPFNNTTQSTITFEYKGVDYSQDIQYLPSSFAPIYGFPTIYNYEDWLRMVNLQMANIWILVVAAGAVGNQPLFIYDPTTGLINLYFDSNFLPGGPNQVRIFMNRQLFSYFVNFRNRFKSANPANLLLDYLINIDSDNSIVLPAVGSRVGLPIGVQLGYTNLYVMTDSAPSTASWSSVRSLILESSMPFRSETVPSSEGNDLNADSEFTILSDFLIPVESKVTDFRVVNEYLPTAEYRYVDLVSDSALRIIDASIFWTDFSGNRYPLYMLPQKSFSVKILFHRRNSFLKK